MDFIKVTTKKDIIKQQKLGGDDIINKPVSNQHTPQEAIKENLAELWNVTA